jgi:hypothetical protein
VAGAQVSSVHGFVSAQFGGAPPWQVPPEQVSVVVQALPSSQALVLFACWQEPALHVSSVQGLLSLQSVPVVHSGGAVSVPASVPGSGFPPVQTPPLQVWPALQVIPHWPQFVPSVIVSTHAAPHLDVPPVQLSWQAPPEQTWSLSHLVPQVPQLFGSEATSTQVPLHEVCVPVHPPIVPAAPSLFCLLAGALPVQPIVTAAVHVMRARTANERLMNYSSWLLGEIRREIDRR